MRPLMLGLLAALSLSSAAEAKWVVSWAASPVTPSAAFGPFPATPAFHNQTLRQFLRLSAAGRALRIRFTNAYGEAPLAIGAARLAIRDADGRERPGSSRQVVFGGRASVSIPRGAAFLSDTIELPVEPGAKIAVALYLPGDTGPCTCHPVGNDRLEISAPGDFSAAPFQPVATGETRAFIAAVEVDAPATARTVAVLGDSISDGVGATAGADRRWPDFLARRLGGRWGVANEGISGNRVLNDGAGVNALARLDRDVLALPGVDTLIVLEGVNDLGLSFGHLTGPLADVIHQTAQDRVGAEDLIQAYRQIIARAHARGIRVIGATILPYKHSFYWSEEGEAARQAINRFIRTSAEFDGVADFDAAVRDPADPAAIRAGLHSGDHLHGSDEGYRLMAEAVPLALFR
ncbi:MAG: SGNH/GDSL hydrolase family protein [Sphingomonadaceae bacterium]|nr:SGNH/GDSL hydrolase family protein [Sphingomonadaceae bacterium]